MKDELTDLSKNQATVSSKAAELTGAGYSSTFGYGLVNAARAVAWSAGYYLHAFAEVPDWGGVHVGNDIVKAQEVECCWRESERSFTGFVTEVWFVELPREFAVKWFEVVGYSVLVRCVSSDPVRFAVSVPCVVPVGAVGSWFLRLAAAAGALVGVALGCLALRRFFCGVNQTY